MYVYMPGPGSARLNSGAAGLAKFGPEFVCGAGTRQTKKKENRLRTINKPVSN